MQKRTNFTSVTPLPAGISRRLVLETLHDHLGMIDMTPQVVNRKQIPKGPPKASPEEFHAKWYELQDKMSYLPGIKGTITYHVCFHDLSNGVQSHVYAPAGLDIKDKWTVGGNEPGEPREAQELGLGLPQDGLWLREDVDMRCNFVVAGFVRSKLEKSHKVLVDRLVEKSKLQETREYNKRIQSQSYGYQPSHGGQFPSSPEHQNYPPNYYAAQHQQSYAGVAPPPQHAAELPSQYIHPSQRQNYGELPVEDPNGQYRSSLVKAASPDHHHYQQARRDSPAQELPG